MTGLRSTRGCLHVRRQEAGNSSVIVRHFLAHI